MSTQTSTKSETRVLARLTNTVGTMWTMSDPTGQHIAAFSGSDTDLVKSAAKATLVADRGLPEGSWRRRSNGCYSYVAVC